SLGHGEGLERGGAAEAARRCAETWLPRRDRQTQCPYARAGMPAAVGARADATQEARPQRPRRDALPASARRERRARTDAGRGIAGRVQRQMERLGRADLRRIRVLTIPPLAVPTGCRAT